MDTNYFVCTLGQAAIINKDENVHCNINLFLEHQGKHVPNEPAVGFFKPNGEEQKSFTTQVLTFGNLLQGVQTISAKLQKALPHTIAKGESIALLCPSNVNFMFTWLSIMRLGGSVLLLAPQLQATAIVHLCKTCNVSTLIYEEMYKDLANEAVKVSEEQNANLELLGISAFCDDAFSIIRNSDEGTEAVDVEPSSIAYTFHTSGTSSGLPKPIPQTHRGAIGVLPHLADKPVKATFTTTPLYHGGISDCIRAWSSDSLIWLFPGKGLPITAANIIRCVNSIPSELKGQALPPLAYFTSVPYILQMMGEGERGLEILQEMDLVGVGGAALPIAVGDSLISKNVKLVSRYGSAECGFLLSSHRDYENDREWQYLRTHHGMEHLALEKQEDGLSELIVRPGWPNLAKTNREDGSFATSDLLEPHPQIDNAWRYHSRADSQLTLITGKKFDPSPLEGSITSSPLVQDALIFGNDQPYPGVLVFPSREAKDNPSEDFRKSVVDLMGKINAESQSHAKIPISMIVIMPYNVEPLEKSSKGTISRKRAEERYSREIEQAYLHSETGPSQTIDDKDITEFIKSTVKELKKSNVPVMENTDIYAYGLDSVGSIQMRRKLQSLLPSDAKTLPLSIVEDCGTPKKLGDYIINVRQGKANDDLEDDLDLMHKLSKQYGEFKETRRSTTQLRGTPADAGEIVLLTGATGALGAHILDQLRQSNHVRAIFCLVRGKDKHAATERVEKSLVSKGLEGLGQDTSNKCRINVLPARLGEDNLGLEESTYEKLAADVTVVIHLAWEVNFRLRLRNFVKDSISGLHNLLQLAMNSHCANAPLFLYCSSTSSVISSKDSPIREEISHDPSQASSLGYSRSKWVAEQLCVKANETDRLKGRVAIVRVGQLAGDSKRGIWNAKEAWPMMLSTVKLTGSLPALKDEVLNWLPVDVAATVFLLILQASLRSMRVASEDVKDTSVYHVLNAHSEPSWMQMLEWLQNKETFDISEPADWVRQLENMQEKHPDHPAMKLLGLWKNAYLDKDPGAVSEDSPVFATQETTAVAPALGDVQPLDEAYCSKIWDWVQEAF